MTTRQKVARVALVAAGVVIVVLTGLAFCLSYAHLHTVAADNGLSGLRAWAWPGCLDAFIVAGELLMLHNAFHESGRDWWAIGLTAAGSLGSIALNVFGVTDTGAHAVLPYLVAAVPPSAALLAFGALMNRVHKAFDQVAEPVNAAPSTPPVTAQETVSTPRRLDVPIEEAPQVIPVDTPPSTPAPVVAEVNDEQPFRLDADAAREVIEHGWTTNASVRETAVASTRSPSYVQKVFTELESDRGPRPAAGQLALIRSGE
jgi:hypothetical protein